MTENENSSPLETKPSKKRLIQNLGYWIQERVPYGDITLPERAENLVSQSKILDYLQPGGTYLDVGAGLGHIVEKILKAKGETGIRYLSSEPIRNPTRAVQKRVTQKFPTQSMFLKAIGESLPIADNRLDGVSLFFVMHHISREQQDQIVSEIKRAIKPGGHFFLIEDTPETEEEKQKNIHWDRRLNLEPKEAIHNYRTSVQWIKAVEQLGFKLVKKVLFESQSGKKNEGIIKHSSLIFQKLSSSTKTLFN